jgi:hypothetical protein
LGRSFLLIKRKFDAVVRAGSVFVHGKARNQCFADAFGQVSLVRLGCRHLPAYRGSAMTDKIIDVYMGFMDEEVNTVLNGLLKKELLKTDPAKRRPIVLIERGDVNEEGPVLEWPLSRYAAGIRRITRPHVTDVSAGTTHGSSSSAQDTSVEGILEQAINTFLERDDTGDDQLKAKHEKDTTFRVLRLIDVRELEELASGGPRKIDPNRIELSVVRFDLKEPEQSLEPPIIVFRSPEMGLQPSLMSPYIEFILMMVSALSSQLAYLAGDKEEWPLQVTCFGAQGGASSGKQPGSVSYICASLYVGYTFHGGEATPVIALCSQGGRYTFTGTTPFEPSKPFNTQVKAEDNELLSYFIAQGKNLVVNQIHVDSRYQRGEEAGIAKGMSIDAVITLLLEKYKASGKGAIPEVTGTSNWFIGGAQKQALAKLGITGCNMEDYWVLHSMRHCALERVAVEPKDRNMYPVFAKGFLTRVNADPLEIEEEVAVAFQQDMGEKYLSRENYVELLRWGLLGLPLTEEGRTLLPQVAKWSFAEAKIFKQDKRLFIRHLYGVLVNSSDTQVVPDPFYIEIASDLLKGCLALPDKASNVFANPPSPEVLGKLGTAARDVTERWTQAGNKISVGVDEALEAFVAILAEDAGFEVAKGMKVWLRPNDKWPGINANSIQDLGSTHFGDAAVDRAFYKSCNLIALQEHTAKVLR